MVYKETIASQLIGITAGNQVDQQATARQTVKCGSHARGQRRLHQAGTQGHQKLQLAGGIDQAGGGDPGVFARAPGGQQNPFIAQRVGGNGNLPEIGMVGHSGAL